MEVAEPRRSLTLTFTPQLAAVLVVLVKKCFVPLRAFCVMFSHVGFASFPLLQIQTLRVLPVGKLP